jgi:hypothetical protein
MLKYYRARTATWRWPLNVFGNILDITCLNAYIISKQANMYHGSRREFLIQLSRNLCQPHTLNRKRGGSTLQAPIKEKICKVLLEGGHVMVESVNKRELCRKCKRNKTTQKCLSCEEFVCGSCSSHVCHCCCDTE